MPKIKVVVWDSAGNTLLGMQAWGDWHKSVAIQER